MSDYKVGQEIVPLGNSLYDKCYNIMPNRNRNLFPCHNKIYKLLEINPNASPAMVGIIQCTICKQETAVYLTYHNKQLFTSKFILI